MWVTIRRPRGKEKKPTRATSSTARGSITALLRKERRNEDKTHVKQLSGTIFSKDRALNVLKEWYFCLLCRAGFYFAFSIFSHLFDSPEGGGGSQYVHDSEETTNTFTPPLLRPLPRPRSHPHLHHHPHINVPWPSGWY